MKGCLFKVIVITAIVSVAWPLAKKYSKVASEKFDTIKRGTEIGKKIIK